MDSIIEKITLYDLLGYMLPGAVFLILLCLGSVLKLTDSQLERYKDYSSILVFVFIIFSYVCGIIISQIAGLILECAYVIISMLRKNNIVKEFKVDGINKREIKKALVKSGLVGGNIQKRDMIKKYKWIMYGDIQTDDQYKRIHNYASAEVLYKNLSLSFLLGGLLSNYYLVVPFRFFTLNHRCICVLFSVIFAYRTLRFSQKKWNYTVVWFVKKYI